MPRQSLDLAKLLNIPQLDEYLKRLNKQLQQSLSADKSSLQPALSELSKNSSKRLRASLVIAVVAAHGQKIDDKVIKTCAAIELVHQASLVHDDIIDQAKTRWGQPTPNGREGPGQAIVAGDYLLAKACQQAVEVSTELGHLVTATIIELCEGQSQELAEQYRTDRSVASLFKAIDGKTGSLISAACQAGGLCSGLDQKHIDTLANYGRNLGIAFQLIDDLLDLISTPELIGKAVGVDAAQGIYTLPLLLGLKGAEAKKIKKLLADSENSQPLIVDLLIKDGSVEKTIIKIKKYNLQAKKALRDFDQNSIIQGLSNLPEAYMNWALNNLVAKKYQASINEILL